MKIGILTLPLHTNYGGILQVYAMQTVLQRMGHEPILLNKHRIIKPPFKRRWRIYLKRAYRKFILNREKTIFVEDKKRADYALVSQYVQPFIDKHVHYVIDDYLSHVKEQNFDAIIVGSDQIWRPQYYRVEDAFLHFARTWNIKRIVYGASFGSDRWLFSPRQTQLCSLLAKKFNAVSVREASGVELCERFLGISAVHVLDPTLLLWKEDYEAVINGAKLPPKEGNLLVCILDENEDKNALKERIIQACGLKPFQANNPQAENESLPPTERIQPPLEEWLRGIKEAEFVITDSYHVCVFSILYHKPFAVISNSYRGVARIRSLLTTFELQDRQVDSPEQISPALFTPLPKGVQERLNTLRRQSLSFLENALKDS